MILDLQNRISAAQALTATALGTNAIDLSSTGRNIADGEPMGIMLTVNVAADHTTGNETYELDIITDGDSALGSPAVVDTHVIDYTKLTAGARLFFPLPVGVALERYLGINYVLGGTNPTVTVTADLMPQSMVDKYKAYPAGYSISS